MVKSNLIWKHSKKSYLQFNFLVLKTKNQSRVSCQISHSFLACSVAHTHGAHGEAFAISCSLAINRSRSFYFLVSSTNKKLVFSRRWRALHKSHIRPRHCTEFSYRQTKKLFAVSVSSVFSQLQSWLEQTRKNNFSRTIGRCWRYVCFTFFLLFCWSARKSIEIS